LPREKRGLDLREKIVYSIHIYQKGIRYGGNGMARDNGKMGILNWAMILGGVLLFGSVVSFIVRVFEKI
jgi:hypothetical protein